jgi:hypothetical protein
MKQIIFLILSFLAVHSSAQNDDFFIDLKKLPADVNMKKAEHNLIASNILFAGVTLSYVYIIDNPNADDNLQRAMVPVTVVASAALVISFYHIFRNTHLYNEKKRGRVYSLAPSNNGLSLAYRF